MKRSLFSNPLKRGLLAVPAAALMLGAAQSQAAASIGINFWGSYGSANDPHNGRVVSDTAFGLPAADWTTSYTAPSPVPATWTFNSYATIGTFVAGPVTVNWTAAGNWFVYTTANNTPTISPGDSDVLNGGIYGGANMGPGGADGFSVDLSGLATAFPSGYVVQAMTAVDTGTNIAPLTVTDGFTTNTLPYPDYRLTGNLLGGTSFWSPGTMSGVFTNDSLNLSGPSDNTPTGNRSWLSGFIITDQPVVTDTYPATSLPAAGASFTLHGGAIGLGTISYQWQHAGTNIPGATAANYTNASAALADAGSYQLIATSSSFPSSPATGMVAVVSVVSPHLPRTATWDADTSTTGAQDGSGTWSYTATNWWTGSTNGYWGPSDSAIFGASGADSYTVTLAENISANTITFNSGGYTIASASAQSLTLQGTAGITANAAATINAPVSTTNTFLKAGPGALTLSGVLDCPQTFVSAGTLEVLARNIDSPYVVTNGATLKLGYNTAGGNAYTTMTLCGDGVSAPTGLYLLGGKTYGVDGGVLVNNAPTTIRQYGTGLAAFGQFDINTIPGLYITAPASGSVLDPNIQLVSYGSGMLVTTDPGANTATGDLVINAPLNVGNLGLSKEGTGSVRLNGGATPANTALNVMGGSVICGTANCVGANATLNVGAVAVSGVYPASGTTFDLNGLSQTVSNATLAGNVKMTINKGGSPTSTVLTVTDASTALTYGGTLTVTNIGGALAIGDSFTLFNNLGASGYSGSFANLNLPPLGDGQAWRDNTTVNGSITVITGSVPPTITTDLPTSTIDLYVGTRFTLSVGASGDPVLHYHWTKNGTTPVGTDSATLTLASVATSDTGDYSVTVTNPYGSASSATNHLTMRSPTGYPAIVTATGPTAYWPLDEAAGPTAFDYPGNHNATYSDNGLSYGSTGPRGTNVVTVDGTSGQVACPYSSDLNPSGPFTVEAWLNPASVGRSTKCPLSSFHEGIRAGWFIGMSTAGWILRTYNQNGQTAAVNLTNGTPTVGKWDFVVGVWDGSQGYLYLNGVLQGTSPPTNFVANPDGAFTIGSRSDSGFYWAGSVGDVAFYNRALSSQEIQSHAQNRPVVKLSLSDGSPVLTWPAGTLQAAPEVTGTYTNVPNAASPWPITPTQGRTFYRLTQ